MMNDYVYGFFQETTLKAYDKFIDELESMDEMQFIDSFASESLFKEVPEEEGWLPPNPVINDKMFGGTADTQVTSNMPVTSSNIFNYLLDESDGLTTHIIDPWLQVVNPITLGPVTSKSPEFQQQTLERVKPYHPSMDHDYPKPFTEEKSDLLLKVKEEINEDEPVVDVWKIDNFGNQQAPKPFKETRRSSRAAEVQRRAQARKISESVHAVVNKNVKRPRNTRQYKNMRVKNSVETTPSQSDIEEWYSQPTRATNIKITKKKTTKGRIDHSESERIRRTVLTGHFTFLKQLLPTEFLSNGDITKVSKQKALSGTKAYIDGLENAKAAYQALQRQNEFFKEKWQKRTAGKMLKYAKRPT